MSKEFLGDPTLEKRYLVAVDMYVYAENDHMARTKVHDLVEVLDNDKKLFFYEWHVQKGSDKDCSDCWFTSAVSQPFDQGNTI